MNKLKIFNALCLRFLILGSFCFFTLLPLFWTVVVSLKPPAELFSEPFKVYFKPSFKNYNKILYTNPIIPFFINSLITATSAAFLSVIVATPAAYAVVRFKIGGQFIKQWVLSIWFLPPIVASIPIYLAERKLRLLDTYLGLIVPYLLIDVPFAFLLLCSFIEGVPKELEEAAFVDGCSRLKTFLKVVFPLSLPGFLVTFCFCFMFAWNEYFFALLLTGTRTTTLPVHITSYLSIHSIGWGEVAACSIIISVPMLILLLVIQKHLVKGLTLGALQ